MLIPPIHIINIIPINEIEIEIEKKEPSKVLDHSIPECG